MRINIKTTLIEIEIKDYSEFASTSIFSDRLSKSIDEAIRIHSEVAKDLYENEVVEGKSIEEEHKQAHIVSHGVLLDLFGDYVNYHKDEIECENMPIKRLIEWSYQQTINPTK